MERFASPSFDFCRLEISKHVCPGNIYYMHSTAPQSPCRELPPAFYLRLGCPSSVRLASPSHPGSFSAGPRLAIPPIGQLQALIRHG